MEVLGQCGHGIRPRSPPGISRCGEALLSGGIDVESARIGAAPSANIFTNREAEMVSRSMNLRRLSFILYSSEKDHYLTQLPGIQEKLVDILRTTIVSPMVHSEVGHRSNLP